MATEPNEDAPTITLVLTGDELEMLLDGLHALEYWDYANELDLPRRNGQVLLPEDDPSCWRRATIGADEENAIEQIRLVRALGQRLSGQPSA
jgi:hypothetical protein